jgi:hypothetical protein
MATKKNTGLYIGLAVAAVGVGYLLLSKKAIASTPTTPGVTTPATSSSSSLLNSLLNLGTNIFGSGTSSNALPFAPVSIAPVTTAPASPASGINYIDPSAVPQLQITAPDLTSVPGTDTTTPDLTNLFL